MVGLFIKRNNHLWLRVQMDRFALPKRLKASAQTMPGEAWYSNAKLTLRIQGYQLC